MYPVIVVTGEEDVFVFLIGSFDDAYHVAGVDGVAVFIETETGLIFLF